VSHRAGVTLAVLRCSASFWRLIAIRRNSVFSTLASTGGSFAISPEEHRHQLAVNVPDLRNSPDDTCAIGRTGEVIFEGRGNGNTARIVALLRRSLGLS
jgi:hypothetical protein